jgi:hypothetical protein
LSAKKPGAPRKSKIHAHKEGTTCIHAHALKTIDNTLDMHMNSTECFLMENIRTQLLLLSAAATEQMLLQRRIKRSKIWSEFY